MDVKLLKVFGKESINAECILSSVGVQISVCESRSLEFRDNIVYKKCNQSLNRSDIYCAIFFSFNSVRKWEKIEKENF